MNFPVARVKKIMKEDKDVGTIAAEAIVAVSLATEKFLELIVTNSWELARQSDRRVIAYADLARCVASTDQFEFLGDIIPKQVAMREAIQAKDVVEKEQWTGEAVV